MRQLLSADCIFSDRDAVCAQWPGIFQGLTPAESFATFGAIRPQQFKETTMSNPSIVIASAARTAVGSFNGAFATVAAHELGATAIKGALERAGVDAKEVDEVIMGQVLQAGEGQNPARQAAMKAGVPQEATAWSVNQLCGSGLRAVA